MSDSHLGTWKRIRRVYGSKRMLVATAILFLGMFMALQAKLPLDLANLPTEEGQNSISYKLPFGRYQGPAVLLLKPENMVGPARVEVFSGDRRITSSRFTRESEAKAFWLPRNTLSGSSLVFIGLSSQATIKGSLEFPRLGYLLSVNPILMITAALTVIFFAFILSLLFDPLDYVRYGYFAAIFVMIMAVYFGGLNLLLHTTAAALSAFTLLVILILWRILAPAAQKSRQSKNAPE